MSAESALAPAPSEAAGEELSVVAAEAATEVEAAVAVSDAAPVAAEGGQAGSLPYEERQKTAERIRSSALPPAMRECLARVVLASGDAAGGQTRVPVDDVVRAVEEAVPDFLQAPVRRGTPAEHPAGDVFFSGDGLVTDAQAEEIAREQLAKSGLLRGQRVRVAE